MGPQIGEKVMVNIWSPVSTDLRAVCSESPKACLVNNNHIRVSGSKSRYHVSTAQEIYFIISPDGVCARS